MIIMEKPTKGRMFVLTLPLAAFLTCVMGTSIALLFANGRIDHVKVVYGMNGATGVAALISLGFLSWFARFDKALFCFIVPFFQAIFAMAVVLVIYRERRLRIDPGFVEDFFAMLGMLISGVAWIWLFVLWGCISRGKIVASDEENDGAGEDLMSAAA